MAHYSLRTIIILLIVALLSAFATVSYAEAGSTAAAKAGGEGVTVKRELGAIHRHRRRVRHRRHIV